MCAGTDSTLCKNQTYDRHEEGEAACEPLISTFPDSSVFPLVCVTGIRTPECDQVWIPALFDLFGLFARVLYT